MISLSFAELEARAADYDEAVALTTGIDTFCSSSAWVLPAHYAFGPERDPWIYRSEHGWLALALARYPDGARVLQPLEPSWAFAASCLGAAPRELAREVTTLLVAREHEWDALALTGFVEGSAPLRELARALGSRYALYRGEPTGRFRASLVDGLDGFLARRSANTRRALRRAQRDCAAQGLYFEVPRGEPDALYARVLAVEATSWKGREGSGLIEEPMRGFYARMIPKLAARGALRLLFARQGERDVGYILGGVLGDCYRGLQFSYDAELEALGVGNAMQLEQLTALCAEGVTLYDLGSEVPYKARWGEEHLVTQMVIVTRRRGATAR